MDYELSWSMALLLSGTGLLAGFINVLAAGGSFLTLPALMLFGIPADIANATNRVGVLLQCVEGIRGFRRLGQLPTAAIVPTLVPCISGALLGSLLASYLPTSVLEPVILATLISMAAIMVLRPEFVQPPAGTPPLSPWRSPGGFFGLFAAGVYGGFIQAGVGFLLLAALCGGLRYDLVRGNALKIAATGVFTIVALAVFIARGQVLWIPGLLLAAGSVVGTRLAVRFAVSVPQRVLRWFLLLTVVAVCLAVWLT